MLLMTFLFILMIDHNFIMLPNLNFNCITYLKFKSELFKFSYKYLKCQVRTRGGNKKYRALRLDTGNFSWGSECSTRKTRIIDVVYNASNNELVRTKTLVKNAIVTIDATPFRQWYEGHYALPLGRKRGAKLVSTEIYA